MAKSNPRKQEHIHIKGDVSGQVAIGRSIKQTQSITNTTSHVRQEDIATLRLLFKDVKSQIGEKVPTEQREKALEKVTELEGAITSEKPDLTTMEYVKNWFGKNFPQLAGAVTGLIVHPIVGKLVEAAGETLAHEFKRRFERA